MYDGRSTPRLVYRCDRLNLMLGLPRCLGFGGKTIDAAVGAAVLLVLEPLAIEAPRQAGRIYMEAEQEQRRIVELELQQARYEASLAERRYAACDPENRLIAAQLERSWKAALQRAARFQAKLDFKRAPVNPAAISDFTGLSADLSAAWIAPGTTMRTRQRLVRALITGIVADIDEATREVVLVIHWKGGQHFERRVRKPKTGEHGCRTPDDAMAVIRSVATRWPDEAIAASLNRMGTRTGQGKIWTAHRAGSRRRVHGMHAYRSAEKDGRWLTLTEAAALLGVSSHLIRRLIKDATPVAGQVVPDPPYQISAADLRGERIAKALTARNGPRRVNRQIERPMFPAT